MGKRALADSLRRPPLVTNDSSATVDTDTNGSRLWTIKGDGNTDKFSFQLWILKKSKVPNTQKLAKNVSKDDFSIYWPPMQSAKFSWYFQI
jgi:hypothetical protein